MTVACTFGDLAVGVFGAHAGAFDDVAALEAHDVAGEQALVALGRHFFEVFALDPHLAAHLEHGAPAAGSGPRPGRVGQGRLAAGLQVGVAAKDLGPVGQHQLQRVQHRHGAVGLVFQVFAQAAFQGAVVDPAVALGHADALGKGAGFGRVAAPAQADDGGHARVVPAADLAVVHQGASLRLLVIT
jgi:hypothetical protein